MSEHAASAHFHDWYAARHREVETPAFVLPLHDARVDNHV